MLSQHCLWNRIRSDILLDSRIHSMLTSNVALLLYENPNGKVSAALLHRLTVIGTVTDPNCFLASGWKVTKAIYWLLLFV